MSRTAPAPDSDLGGWPAPPPRLAREGGHIVVWLEGEQDLFTATSLRDVLTAATTASDGDIVIDLSQVTFIDASALAVIVRDRNRLQRMHRCLTVRAPSRPARRILDVCNLGDLVERAPETVDRVEIHHRGDR